MKETVESLRKQGFRVSVKHYRRIKYVDGLKIKEILENRREAVENYNLHNLEVIQGLQAKGGKTEVHLEAPDGFSCFGVSHCIESDSYNKREGREMALERALEQLNSAK